MNNELICTRLQQLLDERWDMRGSIEANHKMQMEKERQIFSEGYNARIEEEQMDKFVTQMNTEAHPLTKKEERLGAAFVNTYGAGINPEAVQDLYNALERMIDMGGYVDGHGHTLEEGFPERFERAKAAIEKGKL